MNTHTYVSSGFTHHWPIIVSAPKSPASGGLTSGQNFVKSLLGDKFLLWLASGCLLSLLPA